MMRTALALTILVLAVALPLSAAPGDPPVIDTAIRSSGFEGHVLADTSRLEPRFQGVLVPGIEYHAVIEMTSGETIEIALFPETAPNHVANFVSLARKGFYDSVTFHRVIPGFMAQGGDPTGTGMGGPGYTVKAEFSNLPHQRGTLSMARAMDPNSAGSQFFICFTRTPFLDGKYTVFGQVIAGMTAVDAIRPRDPQANPDYTGDAMRRIWVREIVPDVDEEAERRNLVNTRRRLHQRHERLENEAVGLERPSNSTRY